MITDVNAFFGANPNIHFNFSIELLRELMDEHEVEKALVYSLSGVKNDPRLGSKKAVELAKNDNRFLPVGIVNPIGYFWISEEIKKWSGEGVRFFRIFPEINNYPIHPYPPLEEVFDALEEYNAGLICSTARSGTAAQLEVATKNYSFPVIMADTCYPSMAEVLWAAKRSARFYIDTSKINVVDGIETLIKEVGISQLLYGSQAPRHYYNSSLFMVQDAQISDEDKLKILSGNFEKIYNQLSGGKR